MNIGDMRETISKRFVNVPVSQSGRQDFHPARVHLGSHRGRKQCRWALDGIG